MRARYYSVQLILAAAMLAGVGLLWHEPPGAEPAGVVQTFTVDTTADGHDGNPGDGFCESSGGSGGIVPQITVCSLRAAIQEANALAGEQLINFAASTNGVVIEKGTESSDFTHLISQSLTIDGNGEGVTLIKGCSACPPDPVFWVSGSPVPQVTFKDFTLSDGKSSTGAGGINNTGGVVAIDHVTFDGNVSTDSSGGGAVANSGQASMTIDDATFTDNSGAYGGAIFAYAGAVIVRDSHFEGNNAEFGGAIDNRFANLTVQGSTFTDNHASNAGGAISLETSASVLLVEDSAFSEHTAVNSGGAIDKANGTATIRRSSFTGNDVTVTFGNFTGGGIANHAGSLTIEDSVISGNAAYHGGGLHAQTGTVDVVRSAIVGNTATNGGGAMNGNAVVRIANSTLSGNMAGSGTAILVQNHLNPGVSTSSTGLSHVTVADNHPAPSNEKDPPPPSAAIVVNGASGGATFTIKNSALKNPNSGGNCSLFSAPVYAANGSIASDATCAGIPNIDPELGSLTGTGAGQAHVPLFGSPLIDVVEDCTLIGGGAVGGDQRGTVRPQDGDLDGGQVCDIGAIEVPGPDPLLYDQLQGAVFPLGPRSTDHFAPGDPIDSEAADDFIVPGPGGWSIQRVLADGSTQGVPPQSFDVRIYADNGGVPGTLMRERLDQPFVQEGSGFSIALSPPVHVTPGYYWIGVQANNPINADGWFWTVNSNFANAPAVWRNPLGGFATPCFDWNVRHTVCGIFGGLPDQAFQLFGALDSDADGCTDYEENGEDRNFGGERDPQDGWDFYNVTDDLAIDVEDVIAILQQFGWGPQTEGYNAALDREADDPQKLWRTSAATGTHINIDLSDVILNLQSFGHNCAGAP